MQTIRILIVFLCACLANGASVKSKFWCLSCIEDVDGRAEDLEVVEPVDEGLKLPVSSEVILDNEDLKDSFTSFELEEIQKVDMVHYLPFSLSKEEREQAAIVDYSTDTPFPSLKAFDQIEFRYRIESNISFGCQGFVLKARDMAVETETFVAIKLIAKDQDNVREMNALSFVEEHGHLKNLPGSEHVVKLLRVTEYRGWKAMIFPMYGKSWHDLLIERKGNNEFFTLAELRKFTRDTLKALAFLKRINVIHADVKPGNIILTGDSTDSDSILVDFGNSFSGPGRRRNVFRGTLPFMPPEFLARSGLATTEADMWSLGASLYNLMTFKIIMGGIRDPRFSITHSLCVLQVRLPYERKHLLGTLLPHAEPWLIDGGRHTRVRSDLEEKADFYAQQTSVEEFNNFYDFVMLCLSWNPQERLTVEEALQHPFVI